MMEFSELVGEWGIVPSPGCEEIGAMVGRGVTLALSSLGGALGITDMGVRIHLMGFDGQGHVVGELSKGFGRKGVQLKGVLELAVISSDKPLPDCMTGTLTVEVGNDSVRREAEFEFNRTSLPPEGAS